MLFRIHEEKVIVGMVKIFCFVIAVLLSTLSFSQTLNYAQVTHVEAVQSANGTWCFHTEVHHNDEGWDHYADAWQVRDKQDNLLAERILLHPHVHEQPFTRSVCGVSIPDNIFEVIVSARCNVHGFGGETMAVELVDLRTRKN